MAKFDNRTSGFLEPSGFLRPVLTEKHSGGIKLAGVGLAFEEHGWVVKDSVYYRSGHRLQYFALFIV
jgi:hypothetical protein